MKVKKSVLLLAFSLLTIHLTAQDLHFGAKGGLNLNKSSGYNFDDKNSYGYNFGGFISYNFTRNIGVQFEALYGRTTLRTNSAGEHESTGISAGKKHLNYLSFPVLAKVNIGDLLSVVAGPQFNSLQNNSKYKLNNERPAFDSKLNLSYVAGVDIGIIYFRYIWGNRSFHNNAFNSDLSNNQYQLGIKLQVF